MPNDKKHLQKKISPNQTITVDTTGYSSGRKNFPSYLEVKNPYHKNLKPKTIEGSVTREKVDKEFNIKQKQRGGMSKVIPSKRK